jgi:hypothetical protein
MLSNENVRAQLSQKFKKKLNKRMKHIENMLKYLSGVQLEENALTRSTEFLERKHPHILF